MAVSVHNFIRTIGKEEPPPVILFTGGAAPFGKEPFEPYLADLAVDRMIAAHVPPDMRDLALTIAYADETEPGYVAEEASTMPFLVDKRVILVRNADVYMDMSSEKRSPLIPLLQWLDEPSDTTVLMLIASNSDKRKRMYKACEKNGIVVECPQLDDKTLSAWIRDKVAEREKTVDARAIAALIERVGSRLSDMDNAINLIVNYASDRTAVTEEDVTAACADVAEATVWALTDAIAQSQTTAALEALHELLAMNKSFEEIMGIVNWLLESAYRAHPETQLTLQKRFVAEKVAPLARKFSLERLVAAMAMCTRTHFALRTTGADQELLLEMLVIKLAVARGRRATGAQTR